MKCNSFTSAVMAPVNTLAKSLVDVSLGALAFLCAQNRAAIPATKMLAALSVYVGTWTLLSILALSSPILIGGDSASERFSELAPVIILSSPALWTALRHVQILLEILDTMLGIISSAEKTSR